WAAREFPGPLFIGGASAGGQLAVHAALAQADAAQRGSRGADALLLLYPTLHETQRPDPRIEALVSELPEPRRFRPERIREMYRDYLGPGTGPERSALIAGELPAERLRQLPPTSVVSAEADELRASAEQFVEQLIAAGVPVSAAVEPGTVHGYLNRPTASPEAERHARQTIARFLADLPR
ncbi:alpha/beta hydrolase fold domain-containing protein, partial [Leucobacter sp. M11]|uniref:alpha/beta hydrolase fold domain-containing protein n=1 Tax=Leucobacter sp. M11 TaxID=2993565 RepID=UPI002D7E73BD